MDIIDLLITIIVVTILVTIVLGVVTYIAYKLRLARRPPAAADPTTGMRYFVVVSPEGQPARDPEHDAA